MQRIDLQEKNAFMQSIFKLRENYNKKNFSNPVSLGHRYSTLGSEKKIRAHQPLPPCMPVQ